MATIRELYARVILAFELYLVAVWLWVKKSRLDRKLQYFNGQLQIFDRRDCACFKFQICLAKFFFKIGVFSSLQKFSFLDITFLTRRNILSVNSPTAKYLWGNFHVPCCHCLVVWLWLSVAEMNFVYHFSDLTTWNLSLCHCSELVVVNQTDWHHIRGTVTIFFICSTSLT